MAWIELSLRLPAEALPRVEALLQLAGVLSIAITDDGDSPILEPEPGTTPLWPSVTARALFDDSVDPNALAALLKTTSDCEVAVCMVDENSIAAGNLQPIETVEIGPRLTIVPAESLDDASRESLGLHMGLAFGTGQHPTTVLCLQWLEQEISEGVSVLDYGAGSGVLALAALKLGAARAVAIDNEPQALAATARNAELNGLAAGIKIGAPESLGPESFDVIAANILAKPLIDLADRFADRQKPGGRIVLSGILTSQLDEIEACYAAHYDTFERRELADWGLLTGRRRSRYDS